MNTKVISLFLGIIVVAAVTITVTRYAGALTGRWGDFEGMDKARTVLKSLPMEIGDWKAENEGKLDETSINMLRIRDSYVFRTYKNEQTQSVVHFTLMVGPAGKITVHTPEICFGGKDYEKQSSPFSVPMDVQLSSGKDIADTFWRIDFKGRSLDTNNSISFYYGVSTGEDWLAVEDTRSAFQQFRYVYKLQAEAFSRSGGDEDTVKQFLADCLPTIHEHLLPCH